MQEERNKRRRPFQAGVIDVGAHSVRLDLFEVEPDGSLRLLEELQRAVNLGHDVFRNGSVSPETLALLTKIMVDFGRKCSEYKLQELRVSATSAIREAFNRELVINRIFNDSGLSLEVLEEQEETRISFLAMRELAQKVTDFSVLSGISLIVGTGSLLWSYFENGVMLFFEEIPLGTFRLADAIGGTNAGLDQLMEALRSQDIRQRLIECVHLDPDRPLTFIAMGAPVRSLVGTIRKFKNLDWEELPVNAVRKASDAIAARDTTELALELGLAEDAAGSLGACGGILSFCFEEFPFERFICPAITTRSAIIYDMIRKKLRTSEPDPFHQDQLAICRSVGRKFGFDEKHAETVSSISLQLYNKLKRKFDFSPRAERLLELTAILHDIGRFIDSRQHHKHSYYLINNLKIPGISSREQAVIAAMARYHRKSIPRESHPEYMTLSAEEKVTVLKLSAILRVADCLDCSRSGRFRDMTLTLHGHTLEISPSDGGDVASEKLQLAIKGNLFNSVFGIELKLDTSI